MGLITVVVQRSFVQLCLCLLGMVNLPVFLFVELKTSLLGCKPI